MSTLFLNREPINIDIEPTSFDANSLNPFGGRVSKLTLEIDREGFRLINKKGRTVSTVLWIELEELKNEIREKGRFSYRGMINNGLNEVRALMRVGLGDDPAERERLAAIFDKLPHDVFGRKCPDCGGSVVDNVCKNCGQTFTGQQRRKGMKMIMIGGIVFALGIILTYATYNPSSGSVWVFYGAILIGAGWLVAGLIALVFGKRV